MNFEQFPGNPIGKNPIEKKSEKNFQEKIDDASFFERSILSHFREGKMAKMVTAFSLMTALAAASVEKSHASEKPGGDSEKVESVGGEESLESDFFDLSGKKSEGGGMSFVVGEGKSLEELKTDPAEKVEFQKNENTTNDSSESFLKKDANGNEQSRSIGEIK